MRDTARRRLNAGEFELVEKVVVLRQLAFTFEDLNEDDLLVVGSSREAGRKMSVLVRDAGEREPTVGTP